MTNPFEKLALDRWYKVLIVAGGFVFLLTAAGTLPMIPTYPALLLSLGVFFLGLGEWTNHPLQVRISPIGVIRGHPRNPSMIGIAMDIVSAILCITGLWKLFC